MQRNSWSSLNNQQLGSYAEYFVKMELTMHGLQVYSTEVDDRGIDFVARHNHGPFIEVQVKSVRNSNYVFMQKSKFVLSDALYLALALFSEGEQPELYLIPSKAWASPDGVFVSRDYGEGLTSKPEWGINISRKNMTALEPYRFQNMLEQLSDNPAPLAIAKITLPIADVRAMSPEDRSSLLLLGLFLNEANWLRKLLVSAVQGISDAPDGQANFALTMLLATTLAGKVHEGWDRIINGKLATMLNKLSLPEELNQLKAALTAKLAEQEDDTDGAQPKAEKTKKVRVLHRIRNNIGFHYADRKFDFTKLEEHLSDSDSLLYMTTNGYGGDVLSHLSTLAGLEPLLALDSSGDYRIALKNVWEEVTEATGMYCRYISDTMAALIIASGLNASSETITVPDAPNATEGSIKFFVHPPENLEEMRAQLASESTKEKIEETPVKEQG